MATICRFFGTRKEAEAFVEGIEYVNDSSIESTLIAARKDLMGGFDVMIEDSDREE